MYLYKNICAISVDIGLEPCIMQTIETRKAKHKPLDKCLESVYYETVL